MIVYFSSRVHTALVLSNSLCSFELSLIELPPCIRYYLTLLFGCWIESFSSRSRLPTVSVFIPRPWKRQAEFAKFPIENMARTAENKPERTPGRKLAVPKGSSASLLGNRWLRPVSGGSALKDCRQVIDLVRKKRLLSTAKSVKIIYHLTFRADAPPLTCS